MELQWKLFGETPEKIRGEIPGAISVETLREAPVRIPRGIPRGTPEGNAKNHPSVCGNSKRKKRSRKFPGPTLRVMPGKPKIRILNQFVSWVHEKPDSSYISLGIPYKKYCRLSKKVYRKNLLKRSMHEIRDQLLEECHMEHQASWDNFR